MHTGDRKVRVTALKSPTICFLCVAGGCEAGGVVVVVGGMLCGPGN